MKTDEDKKNIEEWTQMKTRQIPKNEHGWRQDWRMNIDENKTNIEELNINGERGQPMTNEHKQ